MTTYTRAQVSAFQINMAVPKLKATPSEWLFLPSDVQPPQPPTTTAPTLPRFKADLSQWLLREPASVEHWLHDIQSHTEEDEDDDDALLGSMHHIMPHIMPSEEFVVFIYQGSTLPI